MNQHANEYLFVYENIPTMYEPTLGRVKHRNYTGGIISYLSGLANILISLRRHGGYLHLTKFTPDLNHLLYSLGPPIRQHDQVVIEGF